MGRQRPLLIVLGVLSLARAVYAVPISITYGDAAEQGFFDRALGVARRGAFEFAVTQWANTLAGDVPIVIAASMPALGGSGGSALLASAGPTTVHRDFSHALPDTWYGAALANELSGNDANGPDLAEIDIQFNADVDGPEALGSIAWYYGTDAQPGTDVDFVTIALHELGHGLGFFEAVDPASGGWRIPNDQPAIFDRMLMRPQVGGFSDVRDAERLAAIISPPLLWKGANLIAFNGGAAAVFTPDPFQPGASISHWDPAAAPGELMGPSYSGPMHDPGLLLPALVDMGWQLAVPSPTPRASAAPPTSTPTATATPTTTAPARTPPTRKDMVYISNFDDATVSVIDAFNRRVTATIPVADGPLGLAATADGTRVYVADFQVGALSVISTRANRVLTTRAVGESANAVAVTADGALVVVTDTAADQAVVIDAASQRVIARSPTGQQPSAVAIGPDGRFAFIADYGEATIAVVDLVTGLRRGIIPIEQSELLGIAIASETGAGFVAAFLSGELLPFDANAWVSVGATVTAVQRAGAAAVDRDAATAYVAGYSADGSLSQLVFIRTDTNQIASRVTTGDLPAALALSSDGATLYVANAGSNSVSMVSTRARIVIATIPVGASPMGVAVAAVPQFCNGDCNGDGSVAVNELVQAVGIALDEQAVGSCPAADRDDDGAVTVDEILDATQNALHACSMGR